MDSVVSDARGEPRRRQHVWMPGTNQSPEQEHHRQPSSSDGPVKQFSGLMMDCLPRSRPLRTKTSVFTGVADEPKSDQTRRAAKR